MKCGAEWCVETENNNVCKCKLRSYAKLVTIKHISIIIWLVVSI